MSSKVRIALSGGPLDAWEGLDEDWLPSQFKDLTDDNGKTYKYRRLDDNEELGTSSMQAVFVGVVKS